MNPYLIISILIVVGLIVLFFVTFMINRRTPVPEGCENIKISSETCLSCAVEDCSIKDKFSVEKLKEELEKTEDNNKWQYYGQL